MKKLILMIHIWLTLIVHCSAQIPDVEWLRFSSYLDVGAGGRSLTNDDNGNLFVLVDYGASSNSFAGIGLGNCTSSQNVTFGVYKLDSSGNGIWARTPCGGNFYYAHATCVKTDHAGNVYVTGYYHGDSIAFGNVMLRNPNQNGFYDNIFLVKYDSGGNALWAKTAGGKQYSNNCYGNAIAIDGKGNCYLGGSFSGKKIYFDQDTVFITLVNSAYYRDLFIAKFDSSGNTQWAKGTGGEYADELYGMICYDNKLYITGDFMSQTVPMGATVLTNNFTTSFQKNLFIAQLDTSGNFHWAKSAATTGNSTGISVASNKDGLFGIIGSFKSDSIILGAYTLFNSSNTSENVFVATFDSSGNFIWAKAPSKNYDSKVNALSIAENGDIYITGMYGSEFIKFDSIILRNPEGNYDIFAVKYSSSGNLSWAKSFGGKQHDFAFGITNLNGTPYISGTYWSPKISFGNYNINSSFGVSYRQDMFLIKLSGVCQAATITQQSESQYGFDNQILTFDVQVIGDPPIRYQWYHNNYSIFGAVTNTYTTPPITSVYNSNTYYCSVSNCDYSFTTFSNPDTIMYCQAPIIYVQPKNEEVEWGDTAQFYFFANGSSPMSYQWYKDGIQIPGATNSNLRYYANEEDDESTFYCQFSSCNNHSVLYSKTVNLIVNGLKIFPIPVSDVLNINCLNLVQEVTIMDLFGRIVYQNNPDKKQIDMSIYESGTYILKVKTTSELFVKKIILLHR